MDPSKDKARRKLSNAHETSARALYMPKEKRGTYISRLFVCLEACLEQLGITTENHPNGGDDLLQRLESMACLIHESMSISSRNYHSVQHVFDVAQHMEDHSDDPIAVIAALFHDCVYYHVDGGLSDLQHEKCKGAVVDTSGPVTSHPGEYGHAHIPIYTNHKSEDELLGIVESIFGYSKGQNVNHQNGLNEFLSAVICVRELEPLLPKPILAQLACCIEATIPFRSVDKETGKTCMERLYDNLAHTNKKFKLGLTKKELVKSVQRAADLCNSDVANFGTTDVFWFLDNTWSLLPESNEGLRRQFLSSVQQFQFAVFKMYGFFNFLQAGVVFPHFQGVPARKEIEQRTHNAERNIDLGRKYVGAKLLSLSVLSAFAELTGGDAPISLFMGDLPGRHSTNVPIPTSDQSGAEGFSYLIPQGQPYHGDDSTDRVGTTAEKEAVVYEVLSKGRRTETSFDVKQSPMAAYLYSILGDDELATVLKEIKVYPMTKESARALLKRLPQPAVREIARNIAHVAISRTEKILALVDDL